MCCLKALFHSIGCPVRLEPDAQDGHLTRQKWSEKASSDRPRTLSRTPDRLSPRDKMSPIDLGCPAHQPIKWSSTDYLATVLVAGLTLGSLEREFCLISQPYSL